MPQYDYLCKDCNKEFTVVEHISEHGKNVPKCPQCGSNRVEPEYSAFSAVTSRKS